MRRGLVVPGVLMLLSSFAAGGAARAQPPGKTRPAPARRDTPPQRKSPALALGLGVGFTATGAILMAVDAAGDPDLAPVGFLAMYVGPSIGRWYGGGSAAIGLIARAAGVAVVLSGIDDRPPDTCIPEPELGEDCSGENEAQDDYDRRWRNRFIIGGALWFGSTLYDFIMAPLDAREHNRERGLAIAPTVVPGGAGLALGGSF
jgi:hypothetical protein